MRGKILADGVISGDDGNRYTYEIAELKNNHNVSAGSEVDFQIKDNKAIDIYVIKQQSTGLNMSFLSNDLMGLKTKVFVMFGCFLLTFAPQPVGIIFAVAGLVLYILIVLTLTEISQSTTLMKNWIISIVVYCIGVAIVWLCVRGATMSIFFGSSRLSQEAIVGIVFGYIIVSASVIYAYRYYKEIAYITNEPYFMQYFWCWIIGTLTAFIPFIGAIILFIAGICYIVAWVKVKEIRKSYSAIS